MKPVERRGPPPCVPEAGLPTPCGKTSCDKVFCLPDLPPATDHGQVSSTETKASSSVLALRTSTKVQDAFVTAQTAGLLASLDDSATALYPWNDVSYSQSHVFTNESGLPKVNDQLDLAGGAAIGVGGAILDLGSLGADLVISVDANPKIARAVQLFTGMLLALPDSNPAEQLLDWLVNPDAAKIAAKLKAVGVDDSLLKDLPEFLLMTQQKLGTNNTELYPPPDALWCRGPGSEKKVAHLVQLARRGRIIAVRSDLADPKLAPNLKKLVEKAGVQTKLVHFSNALDYIPDIGGVCDVFAQLNLHPEAHLTTSASARFSAVRNRGAEASELIEQLGKPGSPAVLDAHTWLSGGRGQKLHDAAWDTEQMRDVWWQSTCSNLGNEAAKKEPAPASLAEYRKRVAQLALPRSG